MLLHSEPQQILRYKALPTLARDAVHVWAFTLTGPEETRNECERVLSAAEINRANRFATGSLRTKYVFAHGVVRHVLARYCNLQPEALEFVTTGDAGKPALANSSAAGTFCFNLSHSKERALLAVTLVQDIGVDIECQRQQVDMLGISSSYFFGSEYEAILSAPESARAAVFYKYWTAKEAVIKAEGIGLGLPLNRFEVKFAPDNSRAAVETYDTARLAPDWTVQSLPCENGWSAAVAARGSAWAVKVVNVLSPA